MSRLLSVSFLFSLGTILRIVLRIILRIVHSQVRLRPLPEIVASFLGLLDDNRMMIDKDGGYVQVRALFELKAFGDPSSTTENCMLFAHWLTQI